MRLEREFTVGAPLDRAWPTVSDAGALASSLPGGGLHEIDSIYTGRLELPANGRRIVCDTTLRAIDRDDDEHVATTLLHARQLGGPGIGSVTVRSRCEAAGSETNVLLRAEVRCTGHEAEARALESVVREILDATAERLGERVASTPSTVTPLPTGAGRPTSAAAGDDAWTGSSSGRTPARLRRAALAGGSLLAVVVIRKLAGRRRP